MTITLKIARIIRNCAVSTAVCIGEPSLSAGAEQPEKWDHQQPADKNGDGGVDDEDGGGVREGFVAQPEIGIAGEGGADQDGEGADTVDKAAGKWLLVMACACQKQTGNQSHQGNT